MRFPLRSIGHYFDASNVIFIHFSQMLECDEQKKENTTQIVVGHLNWRPTGAELQSFCFFGRTNIIGTENTPTITNNDSSSQWYLLYV